jgi:hypothetical protein
LNPLLHLGRNETDDSGLGSNCINKLDKLSKGDAWFSPNKNQLIGAGLEPISDHSRGIGETEWVIRTQVRPVPAKYGGNDAIPVATTVGRRSDIEQEAGWCASPAKAGGASDNEQADYQSGYPVQRHRP